jgi:hypothetical protein
MTDTWAVEAKESLQRANGRAKFGADGFGDTISLRIPN